MSKLWKGNQHLTKQYLCHGNFIGNEMDVLGEGISVYRHQAGTQPKEVIDTHNKLSLFLTLCISSR